MGVWKGTIFSNDMAWEWAEYLVDSRSVKKAAKFLTQVAEWPAGKYLDDGMAIEVFATAELVAAALGQPVESNVFNDRPLAWAARHPELGEFRLTAVRAVERVQAPESQLWKEAKADPESLSEWNTAVADLLQRLQVPA